ncbi:MAG: hypothetical protein ACTSUR_06530, partial [Candidatus Heimdallarchaeaceae archaeon]
FHEISAVEYSLTEKPFQESESSTFSLTFKGDDFEIPEKTSLDAYIIKIREMLGEYKINEIFANKLVGFLISIPKENILCYIIVDTRDENVPVGVLKIPTGAELTISRLLPTIDEILKEFNNRKEGEIQKILLEIKEIEDPGNRISQLNIDDLSTAFLDRAITKNFEKAIFSLVVGDPLVIIGDKPTIRLIMDTLSIFTQHIQYNFIYWIGINNQSLCHKCNSSATICGMSMDIFTSFRQEGILPESITTIDLAKSRVEGVNSSFYLKKLFETIKKLETTEIITLISNELEKIVTTALLITSCTLEKKEEGIQKVKKLSQDKSLPPGLFKKAKVLAEKYNPLLKFLLEK